MGKGDPDPALCPAAITGVRHPHPPAHDAGDGSSGKGCAWAIVVPSKSRDFSMHGQRGEARWAQEGRYILHEDAFVCGRGVNQHDTTFFPSFMHGPKGQCKRC